MIDQFYTKPEIAKQCVELFKKYYSLNDFDYILEPSAGEGSFYVLFPKETRIGIDLDPKYEGIILQDFYKYNPQEGIYAVIGNPPFGRVSSEAIKFFNKAAEFADVIAFIIPRTFKRVSVQNKLSLDFHLINSIDLPTNPCCFTPSMQVKCCFQIWQRKEIRREKIVLSMKHKDWEFKSYITKDNDLHPPEADFLMKAYGSNCGELKDNLFAWRPKSVHFFKANIPIEELKKRLNSLDYSISKDTARQDSIGRAEVVLLYSQAFDK